MAAVVQSFELVGHILCAGHPSDRFCYWDSCICCNVDFRQGACTAFQVDY